MVHNEVQQSKDLKVRRANYGDNFVTSTLIQRVQVVILAKRESTSVKIRETQVGIYIVQPV